MRITITLAKETHNIMVTYFEIKPSSVLTKDNIVYNSFIKPVYVHLHKLLSLKVNVTYTGSNIHIS